MNRLIYKGFIEDVRSIKCTEQEIENLLTIFEEAVNLMAATSETRLVYNLKDFQGSVRLNKYPRLDLFTLTLEREAVENYEKYTGQFTSGKKNLKIVATRGEFTAVMI